jgi:amino acid adenylation domain-containing protein
MQREQVTIWNSVPALMEMMAHHAGVQEKRAVASLRLVMMSGDWIPVSLPERIRQWSPKAELVSLGGATEASIWSILYPIGRVEAGWASIPYGRPMVNQSFAVLDHRLEPVPVWVPGQLYIGGIGVAKGYWRDEERTAASFIVHPQTGERLYRTGDLGRYLPDGNIEFLGREDFQVKIQGHRIELGEIEAALEQHPRVRAAAATAIGQKNDRWLAAFVVMQEQTEAVDAELREFLRQRLPEYMVPATFTAIEQMPLTGNGKVDRQALAQMQPRPGSNLKAEDQRPRTAVEERLAQLWAEILGIEQVGIHQNLFQLGGNSLVAIRIVTRVRELFGVDLPLRELFQALTVAGLGELISQAKHKQRQNKAASLERYAIVPDLEHRYDPFPLNDVQHAYWMGRNQFFELGNVAGHGYVELDLFEADLTRLEQALHRLIARHGMLRAVMMSDGRQRILENVPQYRIKAKDLRGLPADRVERELEATRERMSHQIMPAEQWPLFEIAASILDEGRIRVNVSIDLLIVDAWSARLLFQEMALLYEDPQREMEELELSFRDYVLGEMAFRNSDLYRESQEYWRKRVQDLPPAPELPMSKSLAEVERPQFVRRSGYLEAGQWGRLKSKAAAAGLTPSSALLAAFAEVLSVWSRNPRFIVNVTVYHRLPIHPQVNQMVGDSTSLNLVAVDNSRSGSFGLRSRALQEQLWEDLEHRYVGGVAVVRELARTQKKNQSALAPVVFTSNLFGEQQLEEGNPEEKQGLRVEQVFGISQTPQVWLDLQVRERGGELSFNWDAVEELFPKGLLDDMFGSFCTLLERLAEQEQLWHDDLLDLLPEEQRAQRVQANPESAPVPEGLLHDGIAQQARMRPEQVAIVSGNRRITYHDLICRSSALGKKLRELGALPNQLVAVVMEKGWEQIVGVLGVLDSGAAYLPLDPNLPQQRLWQLLDSGEVKWVVTQPWIQDRVAWPSGTGCLTVEWDDAPEPIPQTGVQAVQKPEDLAYVLFTSGSTGAPKGVMISHRAALNTVVDVNRRFAVGSGDCVLGISALNFDLSVYDIFGVLSAGGTLVLPEPTAIRDPGHWLELMETEGVTLWNSVPALMEMLVNYTESQQDSEISSLRLVMLSGDWIPVSLPDRVRKWCSGTQVVSLGGPTEASIWQAFYPIGEVQPEWPSIPYGRPLTNHRILILDHRLEPVPVWVPGELYIGGTGLAHGYWKDRERTEAAFITHPRTGERLYRSGDIGRFLPDGNIEFLGREDFQVKIQGHRIELGEIEAALLQCPEVRAGAVAAIGKDKKNRRLAAYVVLKHTAGAISDSASSVGNQTSSNGTSAPSGPVPTFIRGEQVFSGNGKHHEQRHIPLPLTTDDISGAALPVAGNFSAEPFLLSQLQDLLGSLLQIPLENPPLPKYRYPSAGHLYPVQAYVLVKPRRIQGILGGIYYYHPKDHSLVLLTPIAEFNEAARAELQNRTDENAAFLLFLVARMNAILPMYGPLAPEFCLLEGGYMGRLLTLAAASNHTGLIPVPGIDFDSVKEIFKAEDDAVLVHAFQGGSSLEAHSEIPTVQPFPAEPAWNRLETIMKRDQRAAGDLADAMLPRLRNEIERLEFKLGEAGLRKAQPNQTCIQFDRPDSSALMRDYLYRQSDRDFLAGAISLEKLGSCLSSLSHECRNRQSLLQLCGIDGSKALQVYLYLKKNAVENLPPGLYRYSPDHSLELLAENIEIESDIYGGVNREVFEHSAFSLYFVGHPSALGPSWHAWERDLLLLEAGSLGQNLMMAAPANSIGLCAIGSLNFERIRPLLGDAIANGILLHSFCGGRIVPRYRLAGGEEIDPGAAFQSRDSVDAVNGKTQTPAEVVEKIQAFLSERLPEYMVPARIVELKELPLNANGKVARNALPELEHEEQSAVFVAPSNPVEKRFAQIWSSLLGKEHIGIHDSFFSLGGDSVKGIQFLARARQEGLEVAVREFFIHPTIADLARLAVQTTSIPSIHEAVAATESPAVVAFTNTDLSQEELDELIKEFGDAEKTA